MCMIDGCDGFVTVLSSNKRKARKEHHCTECRRTIQPGETYLNEGTLWEGEKSTYKTCAHCVVVRDWLISECGGFIYSGVLEDIAEHASESGYGFGVTRLAVGIENKWKRKDGRLFPIPRMPKTSWDKAKEAA